ncbi:MAG: hypothetical protein JOZ70_06945 [Pseudolabrys sp.]|nr:hypothetical protein [Pseudolabrys sp.]MBV9954971.1 hypothetical protein [Pseudolabrys sp.]
MGSAKRKADPERTVGKRIRFDRETWREVEQLARDQMKDLEEIAEEAFRDLLKKHGRSADLREALKMSARSSKHGSPTRH